MHDRRWIAAFEALGFDVDIRVFSEHPEASSLGDVTGARAVVAGPMHTVARHLLPCALPVIGLSWGYDLQQGNDVAWLAELSGLIVDTEHTREIAIAAGIDQEHTVVIPWGVDIERIDQIPPAHVSDLAAGERMVLSARAHEPIYRVEEIIRAFARARLSRTRLVIAHSGTLTNRLRSVALDLGVNAVFVGSLSEDELIALIKRADVYVSASEIDGTSVTLLQALACGTRVVVSDTPGNLEWVSAGRTGWVFPTGDEPALASSIAAALNDETPDIVDRARREVQERANWGVNIRKLLTILPTQA